MLWLKFLGTDNNEQNFFVTLCFVMQLFDATIKRLLNCF